MTYGQGLPQSLKTPVDGDESPAPVSPDSGDNESAPDTLVPSNFDHPEEDGDDDSEASRSMSLSMFLKLSGRQVNGMLIMLGLICTLW